MEIAINYLAVVAAALAAFALGAWWYSPWGFGRQWMQMMGFTSEDMKDMPLGPMQAMGLGFVTLLVTAYVLAHFVVLLSVSGLTVALELGFWLWIGFAVPILAGSFLWEGRPLKLFLFNAAYQLASIELMAVILALWR